MCTQAEAAAEEAWRKVEMAVRAKAEQEAMEREKDGAGEDGAEEEDAEEDGDVEDEEWLDKARCTSMKLQVVDRAITNRTCILVSRWEEADPV